MNSSHNDSTNLNNNNIFVDNDPTTNSNEVQNTNELTGTDGMDFTQHDINNTINNDNNYTSNSNDDNNITVTKLVDDDDNIINNDNNYNYTISNNEIYSGAICNNNVSASNKMNSTSNLVQLNDTLQPVIDDKLDCDINSFAFPANVKASSASLKAYGNRFFTELQSRSSFTSKLLFLKGFFSIKSNAQFGFNRILESIPKYNLNYLKDLFNLPKTCSISDLVIGINYLIGLTDAQVLEIGQNVDGNNNSIKANPNNNNASIKLNLKLNTKAKSKPNVRSSKRSNVAKNQISNDNVLDVNSMLANDLNVINTFSRSDKIYNMNTHTQPSSSSNNNAISKPNLVLESKNNTPQIIAAESRSITRKTSTMNNVNSTDMNNNSNNCNNNRVGLVIDTSDINDRSNIVPKKKHVKKKVKLSIPNNVRNNSTLDALVINSVAKKASNTKPRSINHNNHSITKSKKHISKHSKRIVQHSESSSSESSLTDSESDDGSIDVDVIQQLCDSDTNSVTNNDSDSDTDSVTSNSSKDVKPGPAKRNIKLVIDEEDDSSDTNSVTDKDSSNRSKAKDGNKSKSAKLNRKLVINKHKHKSYIKLQKSKKGYKEAKHLYKSTHHHVELGLQKFISEYDSQPNIKMNLISYSRLFDSLMKADHKLYDKPVRQVAVCITSLIISKQFGFNAANMYAGVIGSSADLIYLNDAIKTVKHVDLINKVKQTSQTNYNNSTNNGRRNPPFSNNNANFGQYKIGGQYGRSSASNNFNGSYKFRKYNNYNNNYNNSNKSNYSNSGFNYNNSSRDAATPQYDSANNNQLPPTNPIQQFSFNPYFPNLQVPPVNTLFNMPTAGAAPNTSGYNKPHFNPAAASAGRK